MHKYQLHNELKQKTKK